MCYNSPGVKEECLTRGGLPMEAFEMTLLFDYYGGMLTEKQRQCFDMRYNQDLSLGEIAQDLGVSRQAVCDNLTRTEALLRKMEANVGYVAKDLKLRKALEMIRATSMELEAHSDPLVAGAAENILRCVGSIEE